MATTKKRGLSKQGAFLAAYVSTASVTKAARAAKIDRSLVYQWLAGDDEFLKAFAAAKRDAAQLLEDEAVRRAYEGVSEPVIYQGGFCYALKDYDETTRLPKRGAKPLALRKYSDGLLQFLLKGFRPDTYRERGSVELSGPGGGPIQVAGSEHLDQLTDEELAALIAAAQKLKPEKN